MNRPTAFTSTIDLLLSGAKTHARARAGPTKKTSPPHLEDLATVFSTVFQVDYTIRFTNPIDPIEMLMKFRSLCRFSCFNKLKVKHFELVDNNILITFLTAKTISYTEANAPACPPHPTRPYALFASWKCIFADFV
jgi:hypothetical protein